MNKAAQFVPEALGPVPEAIGLTHVFDMHYGLKSPIDIGICPSGRRVYFSTSGGVFEGPNIRGNILPEGADWTLSGSDLVSNIDAGILMRTDDNAIIMARWLGKMRADPGVLASITNPNTRADIAPSSMYLRTTPNFETCSEEYRWLTQSIYVASAQFTREGLSYRVMRVD